MKIIKPFLSIICLLCLFNSCNKDLSLEGAGSLKASGSWNFNESSKLYDGNIDTAFIQSNGGTKVLHLQGPSLISNQLFNLNLYTTDIFKPGSYMVSTSQVDFSLSTITKTLYQSDILAGEFIVTINDISNNTVSGVFSGAVDDSNGVTKNIVTGNFSSTIDLSTNNSSASTGTLGTSSGVCTPATVNGTYTQNTLLNSTNTVQIQVNVTTPGTFTINTNVVNGVSFSKSGTFTNTGVQNVILDGAGTPTTSGTKTFSVAYGANTCNFDVMFN